MLGWFRVAAAFKIPLFSGPVVDILSSPGMIIGSRVESFELFEVDNSLSIMYDYAATQLNSH